MGKSFTENTNKLLVTMVKHKNKCYEFSLNYSHTFFLTMEPESRKK